MIITTTSKQVTSGFAHDTKVDITYTNPVSDKAFVVINLYDDPLGGVISGLKLEIRSAERLHACLAEVLSLG